MESLFPPTVTSVWRIEPAAFIEDVEETFFDAIVEGLELHAIEREPQLAYVEVTIAKPSATVTTATPSADVVVKSPGKPKVLINA